jgi:hypothetical protein
MPVRRRQTDLPTLRQEIRRLCIRRRSQYNTVERPETQERRARARKRTTPEALRLLAQPPTGRG